MKWKDILDLKKGKCIWFFFCFMIWIHIQVENMATWIGTQAYPIAKTLMFPSKNTSRTWISKQYIEHSIHRSAPGIGIVFNKETCETDQLEIYEAVIAHTRRKLNSIFTSIRDPAHVNTCATWSVKRSTYVMLHTLIHFATWSVKRSAPSVIVWEVTSEWEHVWDYAGASELPGLTYLTYISWNKYQDWFQ